MTNVLAISSQVSRGAVGNSAAVPALEKLGIEVWPVPTVIWSNHPGHGAPAGPVVPAEQIEAIVERLAADGGLERCTAVLTGYFAAPAQIDAAARAIDLVRAANPDAVICCDPIIGDDPGGLYVAEPVAEAIRDTLLKRADIITPNRFELAWLTGRKVTGLGDAIDAARVLGVSETLVTSVPGSAGTLATAHIAQGRCHFTETAARSGVPHGIGDLLSAFFLGYRLGGHNGAAALGLSCAWIDRALDDNLGKDDLDLVALFAGAGAPAPVPVTMVE